MDFPSNQPPCNRRTWPENPAQNPFENAYFPYFPQTHEINSAFSRLNVSDSNQISQISQSPYRNPGSEIATEPSSFLNTNQRFLLESRRRAILNQYSALHASNPLPQGFRPNGFVLKNKHNFRSNFDDYAIRAQWMMQQQQESLSVEDLQGKMVDFAKDQYGCRLLQNVIEDGSREIIDMVFFEMIDTVGELMVDPSANYVIQKLVEVCSEEQRTQILLMITRNEFQLVSICVNTHGTRVIQKLLQRLSTQQQISVVVSAICPRVVSLTKEMNGHHVILHFLKHFSEEDNKYLLNQIAANCFTIATDKSGCCILQQCVELSKGEARERLVREIIANAPLLAENCYGNYVLQHLLEMRVPEIKSKLVRQLQGFYMSLSCNKYGSNVVEKCLKECGEQHAAQIIMELLNNPNASMLLLDPYGNYVIQKALSVSTGDVHTVLFNLVWKNSHLLRNNMFGKKILAWFEKNKLQIPRRYPYDGFIHL